MQLLDSTHKVVKNKNIKLRNKDQRDIMQCQVIPVSVRQQFCIV